MVLGTVGYRSWQSRLKDLPRIIERGKTEGLVALDAGQFDRAHQLLSEAKRALDQLGNQVEGALAIQHGADEAAIFVQLVSNTLEEILDEAAREEPKAWTERFNLFYRGRSVIIDAHLASVPDSTGNGRYELDYQIFRAGEGTPASSARIDTSGLRHLDTIKPKVGDEIIFGARLASFHFDRGRGEWLVGFEPGSDVQMTHAKALETIGWPRADRGGETQH
ncbi:MAG: hypothetical protein NVSMB9_00590 [Isosphaeraceae bacterium]